MILPLFGEDFLVENIRSRDVNSEMYGKHKYSKLKLFLQKMLVMELMVKVSVMNKFEENNANKFKPHCSNQ